MNDPDPDPDRIVDLVLIHGAWQGAWAFDAWLPSLRAYGWRPLAVDLPGNGWGPDRRDAADWPRDDAPAPDLHAYTEHVRALLRDIGRPVVLVGHSGGGITASQVAEADPDRVACLVYLAGMMLPSGVAFADIVVACRDEAPAGSLDGIVPFLEWNPSRTATRVPPDAARQIFVDDVEPVAAERAASLLRAQADSGRVMINRLTAERYGRVPRVYVECTGDRSIGLPVQRRMQQSSPGARCITLDCGHVPQLARPAELTERLSAVLAEVLGERGGSGPLR